MRRDIWIFLFAFGVVLFSWPILGLFRFSLPLYLFAAWCAFIGLIALASFTAEAEDDGG